MGSIPLRIRFDEIVGFIRIYDGIRYIILFSNSWHNEVCDRIRYLISKKSGITDSINHNLARIKIDSYNSSPIEKNTDFSFVIILIKSVVNKIKITTILIYF